MSTTHPAAERTAIAEFMRGRINGGALSTNITIHAADDTLLVTVDIPDFGPASGPTITSASTGSEGTAGAGASTGTNASYARINDGDGTERVRGSVGVGSGEVQISALSIAQNDIIRITNNATWTAPP